MTILELHRPHRPLSPSERDALPDGAQAVEDDVLVVARRDGRGLMQAELLQAAVALARSVPDATFAVREGPLDGEIPSDPWVALQEGVLDGVDHALVGQSLNADQRWIVQNLLRSTDPAEVALGCRIARVTEWRTAVTHIRRLVEHADARVRRDAAGALGALAGPVVDHLLQRLLTDVSPEVQVAAREGLAAIQERQG